MEWHELPKYNGIQVSQLIYKSSTDKKIQDAILVCLNFYATVRRKKKKQQKKKTLAVRQLQGMLRIAVRRFLLLTVAQESAAKCSEALALCNVPQVSPVGCRRLL